MKHIRSEIEIHADVDKVWSVLTEFEKYDQWNPVVKRIHGQVQEGKQFNIEIGLPNTKTIKCKSTCLVYDNPDELRIKYNMGLNFLIGGEHVFRLSLLDDGSTLLVQKGKFTGVFLPLVWPRLNNKARMGLQSLNEKVKTISESISKS